MQLMQVDIPRRETIYRKASQCSSPAHIKIKQTKSTCLRKHVLLKRLHHALQSSFPIHDSEDKTDPSLDSKTQDDLDALRLLSLWNESDSEISPSAKHSRCRRRIRAPLSSSQRIIQHRINEIEQCLQRIHLNVRILHQEAVLREVREPYKAEPQAYFTHRRQYLIDYMDRWGGEWEAELKTLLHALNERPWDGTLWRHGVDLMLDSVHVVIEAM
ncbi:hypothetical protein B0H10DRAFT_865427 [Mycena sp. CBHHK59/15]|nr:hypothetical protein B0H10DRAFT_865427 [Mycena sp. CBHHK59/15]